MGTERSNQNFDATIVGVVEGVIQERPPYLLLDEHSGDILPFDPFAIRAFNTLRMSKGDQSGSAYDFFREIADSCPPRVLEILLEGRSRLFVLLNSPGGNGLMASWINSLNHHVKNTQGETHAYGTREVSSAATHIWREGDYRSLLSDSHSVWHTHSMPDGSFDPAERERERRQLLQYFESVGSGENVPRILSALRESPDAEVCLSGQDLFKAGISTAVFPTIDKMRGDFLKRSGHAMVDFATGKSKKSPNPVKQFFSRGV